MRYGGIRRSEHHDGKCAKQLGTTLRQRNSNGSVWSHGLSPHRLLFGAEQQYAINKQSQWLALIRDRLAERPTRPTGARAAQAADHLYRAARHPP
jgi:hypothetical protein